MKKVALVFGFFFSVTAFGAPDTQVFTQSVRPSGSTSAVISTNLADLTKSRTNVNLDVMMTRQAAATLSYATHSEQEPREKINNGTRLTVDRSQFGIGANFYFKPLSSLTNFAISPNLIFQTEKDPVNTESNTGLGLRAMGIFKPLPRLMAQGGVSSTVVGSETKTDVLVGMGLLF